MKELNGTLNKLRSEYFRNKEFQFKESISIHNIDVRMSKIVNLSNKILTRQFTLSLFCLKLAFFWILLNSFMILKFINNLFIRNYHNIM